MRRDRVRCTSSVLGGSYHGREPSCVCRVSEPKVHELVCARNHLNPSCSSALMQAPLIPFAASLVGAGLVIDYLERRPRDPISEPLRILPDRR